MNVRSHYTASTFLAALLLLSGCGGKKLPGVTGTITMDGKPVDKATVMYYPSGDAGRPSVGVTTSSGYYKLQFSTSQSGIVPGKYKVSITTFSHPVNDGDGNMIGHKAPEIIPDVYNRNTKLEVDVPPDGGTFDFELKSTEGKVIQPRATAE